MMENVARGTALSAAFVSPHKTLKLALLILCLIVTVPFVALGLIAFSEVDQKLWLHLSRTILSTVLWDTALLLVGVGVAVSVIGVATAWLVTMFRFPGRSVFLVALLLPLALPTYVSAFAYIEFLGFAGPAQSTIRAIFGYTSVREYWFPDYRTLGGAIFVMSLVLYPYVYLTARAAFEMQTASIIDASRTLGANPFKLFWKVALPMARPAIVVGVSLALMETANDIGAVEFFGVNTLTTTIFDVWLNRSSLSTAAQFACIFLLVIFFLLALERHARRQQRLFQSGAKSNGTEPIKLTGMSSLAAFLICFLPVLLGFLIPVYVLVESAIPYAFDGGFEALISPVINSVYLALAATIVTLCAGLFFAYVMHLGRGFWSRIAIRLMTLGYAVPGVILAVGLLIPLARFDGVLNQLSLGFFDHRVGLVLSGTTFALIYAYSIRFLPMAYGNLESGFQRMSPNFGHASRSLGRNEWQTIISIYLPLLRPAFLTGGLIVFVDCMKELPATLLMRPFNFDTLATRIYDSASLEVFEEGALPALAIILVGLLPVILLSLQTRSAVATKSSAHQDL